MDNDGITAESVMRDLKHDWGPPAQEAAPTPSQPYPPAVDMVNHPPHYRAGDYECIDVIEAFGLGFSLGSALKYILRADRKGDALADLRKAIWYLEREIARRER